MTLFFILLLHTRDPIPVEEPVHGTDHIEAEEELWDGLGDGTESHVHPGGDSGRANVLGDGLHYNHIEEVHRMHGRRAVGVYCLH